MPRRIDYYHSLLSPYAYLGGVLLGEIANRHGAAVNVMPIQLGKIFPVSGGLPLPKRAPQRQAYRLVELDRWRAHRDLPLNKQPKGFPTDESMAARMVVAARESGVDALALSNAFLRAVWVEERDIGDAATQQTIADSAGFDGVALRAEAEKDGIGQIYNADTQNAIDAGVFGSPTYVVDGEMFWGQDRLDFLERKLQAS